MPTVGTIVVLETTGRFMPYPDLSWQTFRPAEGFYTSEVQAVDRRPICTFLPTGYEHHYAYPLLVFFHGHGGPGGRPFTTSFAVLPPLGGKTITSNRSCRFGVRLASWVEM